MSTLSPIKIPSPPEEDAPKPTGNEENDTKQQEEQLRRKLMLNAAAGRFKFSQKIIMAAPFEYLKQIDAICEQQRSRRMVKMILLRSYFYRTRFA